MIVLGLALCLSAVPIVLVLGIAGYLIRFLWPPAATLTGPIAALLLVPLTVGYQWCVLCLGRGWPVRYGELFRAFQSGRLFWRVMIAGSIIVFPSVAVGIAQAAVRLANPQAGLSDPDSWELAWRGIDLGLAILVTPLSWAGLHAIVTGATPGSAMGRSVGWAWRLRGLFAAYLGIVVGARALAAMGSLLWASHRMLVSSHAEEPGRFGSTCLVPLVVGLVAIVVTVLATLFVAAAHVEFYREFVRRDEAMARGPQAS